MSDDDTPPRRRDDSPSQRRSYSRANSSAQLGQSELKQRMVKLDGEFKGLRAQVTQIWKLLESKGVAPTRDDTEMKNAIGSLRKERGLQEQAMQGLQNELRRQKQEIQSQQQEMRRMTKEFQQQEQEMRQMTKAMQKQHQEMHQMTKEVQKHAKELHLQSKLGMDRDRELPQTVQAVSDDLFKFKRQIYDSGVLVPKLPEPEVHAPEPPVGALELGEDVYSARLLIRLGLAKARKEGRRAEMEERSLILASPRGDTSSDEEGLNLDDEEDLVLGLQPIEVQKGENGYWQITTGWFLVVIFTQALQFIALCNLFAYGIAMGSTCLKEPLEGYEWWMLHLSKAAGTCVVGALMSGRIMETVNFMMVEVLIERAASAEAVFCMFFRCTEILLIIFSNFIVFISSSTPSGIWLSITAITFVADLPESAVAMGKSGALGHHISKQITEMQFQLCLGAEYPWWFRPIKYLTHLIMFGTVGFFACYAFFEQMQICPEDGSPAPNIFLAWMR